MIHNSCDEKKFLRRILSLPITHPTRRKMSGTARSGLFLTARRGLLTSDGVIGSHNGTTGSSTRAWVMLRIGKTSSTEPESERSRSMKRIKFVGMDVHAETIERKSTRLNSSHLGISYAVFCLKI